MTLSIINSIISMFQVVEFANSFSALIPVTTSMIFILLIPSIIIVTITLLVMVSYIKIFAKANEKWWCAIIPFYDYYIFAKISGVGKIGKYIFLGSSALIVLFQLISIISSIFTEVGEKINTIMGSLFGLEETGELVISNLNMELLAVVVVLIIIIIFNTIRTISYLGDRFNKGIGFKIGMVFLPFIFYPILGFGSSVYIPATGDTDNNIN